MNVKILIPALLAAVVCAPSIAVAGEGKAASGAQQAQQQRMKACNAQAKSQGLKGDDRKTYMSSCLKGGHSGGGSEGSQAAQRQ